MASLGIGFVCASMPFNAYRGAVSRGILCNRNCDGVQALADDGDEIEMDYSSSRFTNHTRIVQQDYPAIEPGRSYCHHDRRRYARNASSVARVADDLTRHDTTCDTPPAPPLLLLPRIFSRRRRVHGLDHLHL